MTFTHLLHPEIPKIKQVNIDGIRHYETPDGTLISITSLLKNFTPQGILDWRKAVGEEVANAVMIAATDRGSKVHQIIENCLSNKPETDLVGNYGELASRMFSQMIPAIDKIDRIRALEQGLYSTSLGIAGRVEEGALRYLLKATRASAGGYVDTFDIRGVIEMHKDEILKALKKSLEV